jgi:hypothetical protein
MVMMNGQIAKLGPTAELMPQITRRVVAAADGTVQEVPAGPGSAGAAQAAPGLPPLPQPSPLRPGAARG